MDAFVVDTSVAIKWFTYANEADIFQAKKFLLDIQSGRIIVLTPDILLTELANVFLLSKKLTVLQIKTALDLLDNSRIVVAAVNKEIVTSAVSLADKYEITVYDAVFLALAKQWSCRLISADEKGHGKITDGSVVMLKDYPKI